jgi:hypothetical protein
MDTSVLTHPLHVAAVQAPTTACANCQAPRMGEYCYRCGQHFLEGRLTIRRLVMDFIVRKLGLEGGLLRTVVELTARPHVMIREYVDGRRQRYTNPVAYLLLVAGLYVLVSRLWADALAAGLRLQNGEADGAEVQSFMEAMVQVQLYTDQHPSLMTMVLCLFLVPTLRVLFRGTVNTAEASVFTLFVSAHLLLLQVVVGTGALVLSADLYRAITGPATFVPAVALLFSAGRFFGTRFTSYLKVALALAVTMVGLLMLMVMAALLTALAAPPAG